MLCWVLCKNIQIRPLKWIYKRQPLRCPWTAALINTKCRFDVGEQTWVGSRLKSHRLISQKLLKILDQPGKAACKNPVIVIG